MELADQLPLSQLWPNLIAVACQHTGKERLKVISLLIQILSLVKQRLVHTYTHALIHSYTHTLMHSYTHALIHTHIHTMSVFVLPLLQSSLTLVLYVPDQIYQL